MNKNYEELTFCVKLYSANFIEYKEDYIYIQVEFGRKVAAWVSLHCSLPIPIELSSSTPGLMLQLCFEGQRIQTGSWHKAPPFWTIRKGLLEGEWPEETY